MRKTSGVRGRGPLAACKLVRMRAAIVHYWLLNQRGGEKVLDAVCRLLPDADIFTLFADPATLSAEVRRHRITTSFQIGRAHV